MNTIILDIAGEQFFPSIIDYIPQVSVIDDTRIVLMKPKGHYCSPDALLRAEMLWDAASAPFSAGPNILGKKDISFWRMNKKVQNNIIDKFCKGISGFKSKKTTDRTALNTTTFTSKRVIVKPMNGARSIGQVVFDRLKHTPSSIYETIHEQKSLDAFLQKLKTMNYDAVYHKGHDREYGEGWSNLKEAAVFEEYIEDITHEFRIITGAEGTPVISINRKLETLEGDHQIPSSTPDAVSTSALTDMFPAVNSGLLQFLSEVHMPFHSVDVFVTKNQEWGIFEFSPEFCSSEYGPTILPEEAKKFLRKHLLES